MTRPVDDPDGESAALTQEHQDQLAEQSLFGTSAERAQPRDRWRIEVAGIGGTPSDEVRVTLVDADTGRRVGARQLPFSWLRDVAHGGLATVAITPGEWK